MESITKMRIQIAVATVCGKVYYEFVNELNRRRLAFLSLKPWDPIPFNIKVVLTTKEESRTISHPNILTLEEKTNPESIIDEALLIIQGKQQYSEVVIGVDPGETCGIAILCDNKVLETLTTTLEEAANLVLKNLKRFPAEKKIVRVGDGNPTNTKDLLKSLSLSLQEDITLELVREAGTSRVSNKSFNRRVLRDSVSAIKIAERNGRKFKKKYSTSYLKCE